MQSSSLRFSSNLLQLLLVLMWCIIFDILFTLLHAWAEIIGLMFIIATAGVFFFGGIDSAKRGYFQNKFWILILVLLLPIIFIFEQSCFHLIRGYFGVPLFIYFLVFVMGFIFKKSPNSSPSNDNFF